MTFRIKKQKGQSILPPRIDGFLWFILWFLFYEKENRKSLWKRLIVSVEEKMLGREVFQFAGYLLRALNNVK